MCWSCCLVSGVFPLWAMISWSPLLVLGSADIWSSTNIKHIKKLTPLTHLKNIYYEFFYCNPQFWCWTAAADAQSNLVLTRCQDGELLHDLKPAMWQQWGQRPKISWGSDRSVHCEVLEVLPHSSCVLIAHVFCVDANPCCESVNLKRWSVTETSTEAPREDTRGAMRRQKPSSHHHIEPTCFHLQRFKAQTVNSHPLTLITLNLLMDEQSVQDPLWNQTCAARQRNTELETDRKHTRYTDWCAELKKLKLENIK